MEEDKKKNSAPPRGKTATFKRTEDKTIIKKLISQKLLSTKLTVDSKDSKDSKPKYAWILSIENDEVIVKFDDFIPPIGSIQLKSFINDYYTEVNLNVVKPIHSHSFLCKANFIRIASIKRENERLMIGKDEEIYVNYIKISHADLKLKGDKIPLSCEILFENCENDSADLGDRVKISSFENISKESIYNEIRTNGKSVFVANTKDVQSFEEQKENSDILDLKEYYNKNFSTEQSKLIEKEKIGWIICPINIPIKDEKTMPIGYIELSTRKPIDIFKYMEVQALALKIVEKIFDMNVSEFKEKQRILDISRGGLCIEFKNKKLIENILKRRYFIFDIIIRMQAPITFQGWVRFIKTLEDGTLHCGVKIQGETSRPDRMKRYLSYVNTLSEKKASKAKLYR